MARKRTFPKLPKVDLTDKRLGFSILLAGIVLALLFGAFGVPLYWLLLIGVVVGILNIFHGEGVIFLISTLTMAVMLFLLTGIAFFPLKFIILFNAVIYLLAPAALIVSLKVIYALTIK